MQQQIRERRQDPVAERFHGIGTGRERRHVTLRTPDLREDPLAPRLAERGPDRRRSSEQAHEGIRRIEILLRELRVCRRIDAGGKGVALDELLAGLRRVRDPHLVEERPSREFQQRRDLRLAAEAADAPVGRPVRAPRDAVVVSSLGIGQRQNLRVGHGVQQAEPEDGRRGPMGCGGGRRRHRIPSDPEGGVERGRHAVFEHRPAISTQLIAHTAVERGRMRLQLLADTPDHWSLVALTAGGVVEEGPEPRPRGEVGLEHDLTAIKQAPLISGQEQQGTTEGGGGNDGAISEKRRRVGWLRVASSDNGEQNCERNAGAAAVGHNVLPVGGSRAPRCRGLESGGKRTLGWRTWVTCVGPYRRAVQGRVSCRRGPGCGP